MQAELKHKQDVSATFTVTVPADAVDATFDRILAGLARQVRVPGFRPGRAPRGVLVQRIGAEALAEEVREALVDEHYPRAVQELDLAPVHAHFHAEHPVQGADFTFEVEADLYPSFELPDLDAIELDAAVPEPSDEDVARTVDRLREEHATLLPVERPIEPGDVLTVESLGEGGQTMPVDLSRTEPHLVEQLTGRRIGEELVLDLGADPAGAAPDEAEASSDEAPRRSLEVRVVDVKQKELPEPDDAFATTLGFDSWDATLAEIRSGLAARADHEAFRQQREAFVEQLMAATEMALPRSLVARRQRTMLEELAEDLQRQRGMTLQRYLEELDERSQREDFERELREAAERAVKRDLVLEALLERVGGDIADEEFDEAVRLMAQRERKDVGRFKADMGEEWLRNYRFLLNRDRAVRDVVAAKTGRDRAAADEAPAGAADESEAGLEERHRPAGD
jgi:trigger factor